MGLRGEVVLPGDKSLTHRAILFGSVAEGVTVIRTSRLGRDNMSSLRVIRQLGAKLSGELSPDMHRIALDEGLDCFSVSDGVGCRLCIESEGRESFRAPGEVLYCGNSGTTARLLCGLIAPCPFEVTIDGDGSLRRRPFGRIREPLELMGAEFSDDKLPLRIKGGSVAPIEYVSPRASAQVKSAILLAGLGTSGTVSVVEPWRSRDHTERMLKAMGCKLSEQRLDNGSWKISLSGLGKGGKLDPLIVDIPGDFSAAAFFMVAACITPDSHVILKGVGFNPTRTGLFRILKRMGANISVSHARTNGGEEIVDVEVRSSPLCGVDVGQEEVVMAIDEIPALSVAAASARGTTRIFGAGELRVKESDRLAMTSSMLRSFGYEVEEAEDGLSIVGDPDRMIAFLPEDYEASEHAWKLSGDHRIAMCGAVLENLLIKRFSVWDDDAVETSFPGFIEQLRVLNSQQIDPKDT